MALIALFRAEMAFGYLEGCYQNHYFRVFTQICSMTVHINSLTYTFSNMEDRSNYSEKKPETSIIAQQAPNFFITLQPHGFIPSSSTHPIKLPTRNIFTLPFSFPSILRNHDALHYPSKQSYNQPHSTFKRFGATFPRANLPRIHRGPWRREICRL